MIEDGKNGFLVSPANSAELADRILYLIENPTEASEMANKARETVENRFDWRLIVKKVMKVYREELN